MEFGRASAGPDFCCFNNLRTDSKSLRVWWDSGPGLFMVRTIFIRLSNFLMSYVSV